MRPYSPMRRAMSRFTVLWNSTTTTRSAPRRRAGTRHVMSPKRCLWAAASGPDVGRRQRLGPLEVELRLQRRGDQAQHVDEHLAVAVGELVNAVVVHGASR